MVKPAQRSAAPLGILVSFFCLLGSEAAVSGEISMGEGAELANVLNQQFNDIRASCEGGEAAYKCSGVLMRKSSAALPNALDNAVWGYNYSEMQQNSMKFFYVRADLNNNTVDNYYGDGSHGLLVDGRDKVIQGYCVFPTIGMTTNRDAHGCGTLRFPGVAYPHIIEPHSWPDFSTCAQRGIHTADEWLKDNEWQQTGGNLDVCSLNPDDADEFAAFISAANQLGAEERNEFMMQKWDAQQPDQLPIQAFWFVDEQGRQGAKRDQLAYFEATGVTLPILKYNANSAQPFQAYGE